MSAPAGIDWCWATTTGGALSNRQRAQLLAPLLRTLVGYTITRTRIALGRRGTAAVGLDGLRWPDSQLARDAEAQAREVMPPYLLQHCYRTYVFALALAVIDRVEVDEELGFISCVLHDVDLAHPTAGKCFAVSGGQKAERFALDHGADGSVAGRIGAAVAGHCTPGASEDLSDLAGFVSAGAILDVAGLRYDELDPTWTRAVLERHPRLAFKSQLPSHWAAAAAAMPAGRAQWLNRYAAFPMLIKLSPFPE